jgi:hypothetical protein
MVKARNKLYIRHLFIYFASKVLKNAQKRVFIWLCCYECGRGHRVHTVGVVVYLHSFLTLALDGVVCSTTRPVALSPRKARYLLCRRVGGPKRRSGQVWKEELQILRVWKVELCRAICWDTRTHAHTHTSLVDTNNEPVKVLQAHHLMKHLQTAHQQANIFTNNIISSVDMNYARGWKVRGSSPGRAKGLFLSPKRPDLLWGPLSHIFIGYEELFLRG